MNDNNDGHQHQQDSLIKIQNITENVAVNENAHANVFEIDMGNMETKITDGFAININCDFCEGPVYGDPKVLKFADIERFFC